MNYLYRYSASAKSLLAALVLLLGLLVSFPASAEVSCDTVGRKWAHSIADEVTRTISEKYKVSAADKLQLINKYGKVHINTWDKNEITVDVNIKAWDKDRSKAEATLNKIKVEYGKTGNLIRFETTFSDRTHVTGKDSGFEINYTVNMPKGNALDLQNKFGPVFLADFKGDLKLSVRYGSFKGNKITGSAPKNIDIGYGSANIDELEKGDLLISYSSAAVLSVDEITLINKYSNTSIEKAGTIKTETKYGELKVGQLESVSGSVSYAKFQAKTISKSLNLEVRYAHNFLVEKMARGFANIDINNSYSSIDIGFEEGAGFDFDISTSYGNFRHSLGNVDMRKQIESGQNAQYEGSVGKKSNSNVKVISRYGSVKFK